VSFVVISPDAVSTAAADLDAIGSTLVAANATAVAPTTTVVAAARDEVSTGIAQLFGVHAKEFQAATAQAAFWALWRPRKDPILLN